MWTNGVGRSIIGGGGAHIHIFMFTDQISKGINCAEHEYMNMSPPINDLPTPLMWTTINWDRRVRVTKKYAAKRISYTPRSTTIVA